MKSRVMSLYTFSVVLLLHLKVIRAEEKKLELFEECSKGEDCESNFCCELRSKAATVCMVTCMTARHMDNSFKENTTETVILGRRYKAFRSPMLNWFQALTTCIYDDGMLTDIRNLTEHTALAKYSKETFADLGPPSSKMAYPAWVGASSITKTVPDSLIPQHLWNSNINSSKPAEFFQGDVGRGTSTCVAFARGCKGSIRCLQTLPCSNEFPFICVYPN